MAIGGSPFKDDLQRFADKAERYANAVVHRVVIDLSAHLIYSSPVGDPAFWNPPYWPPGYTPGSFRANWQYGDGFAPTEDLQIFDPEGKATIRKIAAAVPTDANGKVHYIVNNKIYAEALEKGHSMRQAPFGMVAVTTQRFTEIVDTAVGSVKSAGL